MPVVCETEKRSDERRECVTTNHQPLSFAQTIAEITGEQFQQTRHRFRESLNHADGCGRRTETNGEENRQQWIDYFARGVVKQTDETNSDYVARQSSVTAPQIAQDFLYEARTTVLMLPRTWKSPSISTPNGSQAATKSSRMILITCS